MSKPYRIWLLLTNKSDDFRLISVTLVPGSQIVGKTRNWEVPKKEGGTFSIPADRLSRSLEQATSILVDRHISDRSLCHPLAHWRSSCSYYYRIAPRISMSNSFVHFSNPRGFYSVFSDFPPVLKCKQLYKFQFDLGKCILLVGDT